MFTTIVTDGNPSWSDSFLKSEGIQSVFCNALVSVQPSSAEELTETAVSEGLEETLLDRVSNESAIVVVVFSFCSCDRLTGS